VRFRARVVENGPVEASCSFGEAATLRRYECRAENVGGGDRFAFVRFSLVPIGR
jgi:hypothetical protein